MKLNSSRVLVSVLGFFFLLVNCPLLLAAEKAPFYQGKTLNIVINFAAGGPTDIEAECLAKHW
jgi:tripartite-type tricarboxylate transporter receptor subunit TctC